jgi:hypothetical protein
VFIKRDLNFSARGEYYTPEIRVRVTAFNATFNNISVILWWSVLLMEETGENH